MDPVVYAGLVVQGRTEGLKNRCCRQGQNQESGNVIDHQVIPVLFISRTIRKREKPVFQHRARIRCQKIKQNLFKRTFLLK
jgi:hypothetical protein